MNNLELILTTVLILNIDLEKLENYQFEFHTFLISIWLCIKYILIIRRIKRNYIQYKKQYAMYSKYN